ncbi:hypothetical protein WR25_22088 [Diploscapter pachys]|uniref:Uncharacterized protein n=1 Tax=Diploscapter pachys TaxID=2018661 RepID=A0A2A2LW31_9BILA|nr:hypothetical protein WR25_22088 [Diploscapter pachys]
MDARRLSLPPAPPITPMSTPLAGLGPNLPFASSVNHRTVLQLKNRFGGNFYFPRCSVSSLSSNGSIHQLPSAFRIGSSPLPPTSPSPNPHARLSQPDLYTSMRDRDLLPPSFSLSGTFTPPVMYYRQRVLPTSPSPRLGGVPRRLLRRAHQSDLQMRFQRHYDNSNESTPSREISENVVIDPVYLALKQATGRYGGSSRRNSNFDSATPSPRNLSQVSLQDSGYSEVGMTKANPLLGSTPQLDKLDNAGLCCWRN